MDLRELEQQYRALRAAAFRTHDDGEAEDLINQCCELQLIIYEAPVDSFDDLVAKANVLTIDLKDGAELSLPLEPASALLMLVRHIEHLAEGSKAQECSRPAAASVRSYRIAFRTPKTVGRVRPFLSQRFRNGR